jgi:low affinity Fe/Cu permease
VSANRTKSPRRPRRTLQIGNALERFSRIASDSAGGSWAFALATSVVVIWAVTGPVFGFSNTWQLVINTGTTIVTFLMVFLIQRAQNKDSRALQLKLNEIVAAVEGASNRLLNVEDLSEEELATLHAHFQKLAMMAASERSIGSSHSVEEAEKRHLGKARPSARR